jgi:hypothetical protein
MQAWRAGLGLMADLRRFDSDAAAAAGRDPDERAPPSLLRAFRHLLNRAANQSSAPADGPARGDGGDAMEGLAGGGGAGRARGLGVGAMDDSDIGEGSGIGEGSVIGEGSDGDGESDPPPLLAEVAALDDSDAGGGGGGGGGGGEERDGGGLTEVGRMGEEGGGVGGVGEEGEGGWLTEEERERVRATVEAATGVKDVW